jgi:hypothetical protein
MDDLNTWFLSADQCRARAEFIRQTAGKTTIEAVRLNLASLAERYEEMAARVERTDTAA